MIKHKAPVVLGVRIDLPHMPPGVKRAARALTGFPCAGYVGPDPRRSPDDYRFQGSRLTRLRLRAEPTNKRGQRIFYNPVCYVPGRMRITAACRGVPPRFSNTVTTSPALRAEAEAFVRPLLTLVVLPN